MRRPASLSLVVPQQQGLAFNRRYLMKDGSVGWNPGRQNPNIFRPLGPTDPDLPFLLVRRLPRRESRWDLSLYLRCTRRSTGTRPLVLVIQVICKRNFAGYSTPPDFVSLFGEGCAGDVNHINVNSADPQRGDSYPQQVGKQLADTVKRVASSHVRAPSCQANWQ